MKLDRFDRYVGLPAQALLWVGAVALIAGEGWGAVPGAAGAVGMVAWMARTLVWLRHARRQQRALEAFWRDVDPEMFSD